MMFSKQIITEALQAEWVPKKLSHQLIDKCHVDTLKRLDMSLI